MNNADRIPAFVSEIWDWYVRHKRTLPWRDLSISDDTQRAYQILISEVMLQQTQVSRVVGAYRRFLDCFPTITDLARATNKEVIVAWKGMGYNSRALRLRDAARSITNHHKGIFPKEYDQLIAIKGIGPYTAAAIRNFAFNLATPGVDTNIRRVLSRTFFGPERNGAFRIADKKLLSLCDALLIEWTKQTHEPRDFFAALMDYGSLVQTKSNPKWDVCPLTAKGIMKTTMHHFRKLPTAHCPLPTRKEPGRMEGARYTPNRIFRGRIVDILRDHDAGLTLETIGKSVCNDWDKRHRSWLRTVLQTLKDDALIAHHHGKFLLAQ